MSRRKLVIAHRGASGYLPEHTLAAKALAHAQGADYLEQDLVMTRDDELIVMHDLFLDRITDVARRYPGRARPDGHCYAIDFTLEEIRTLRVTEPFRPDADGGQAWYPARFPLWQSRFHLHTFAEEIELIQGLNATTGRQAGIYPEIKGPWFHLQEGKDPSIAVLRVLKQYGYTSRKAPVYLQCFDHEEVQRLRRELLPAFGMDLKLVQLIAAAHSGETFKRAAIGELQEPYDYAWMLTEDGMRELARWVDGVGPAHSLVISPTSSYGALTSTGLVANAHKAGLEVHPYTFRRDAGQVPSYAEDLEHLLRLFYFDEQVDGVFTDFPDIAVRVLARHGASCGTATATRASSHA